MSRRFVDSVAARKILVQIPCFNEETTLPVTFSALPESIHGHRFEILVIDDGSTDATADVARRIGAHHVLRLEKNGGLAKSFLSGVEFAERLGVDILVNLDADNQYRADQLDRLVETLDQGADIVVGCRNLLTHPDFSVAKKALHVFGNLCFRIFFGFRVPDVTSGCRAFKMEAMRGFHLHSAFSHTIETLFWAHRKELNVRCCRIGVNPKIRESRLFRDNLDYLAKVFETLQIVLRVYGHPRSRRRRSIHRQEAKSGAPDA